MNEAMTVPRGGLDTSVLGVDGHSVRLCVGVDALKSSSHIISVNL